MVRIFSQKQFRALVPDPEAAVISIQSPTVKRVFFQSGTTFVLDTEWKNILILEFHDVLEGEEPYRAFTPHMADLTLEFMKVHEGRDFYIHCDAGWSRSVAVGAFMVDNFEETMEIWSDAPGRSSLNIHVYNLLRRAHYGLA